MTWLSKPFWMIPLSYRYVICGKLWCSSQTLPCNYISTGLSVPVVQLMNFSIRRLLEFWASTLKIMPGTMITWFDLQSRNLNVLHVFRDSLGAWVFSMHVLRDFLSISPKQYFLLPFRKKTRFSHVSIRNKSYHISHITKVRSDNALKVISQK